MKLKAAAKINLALDITGKKKDGYHTIFSIMQSVTLFDEIEINLRQDKEINYSCSDRKFSKYENNIIKKAIDTFLEENKLENPGFDIYLTKNIPSQAGLAGGSTDAAATIVALNKLFETNLSKKSMIKIGKQVGADVPFCIYGGTALTENIGDELTKLPDLKNYYFVIVKPDISVSTKEAYKEFDRLQDSVYHLDRKKILSAYSKKDHKTAIKLIENVFEQLIEVPNRPQIKLQMLKSGALNACMSGSGTAIFGVFDNENLAKDSMEELKLKYKNVYLAKSCKEGVFTV